MIKITQKGNFQKLTNYLTKLKNPLPLSQLEQLCQEGVNALSSATPRDSGLTANSWEYHIKKTKTTLSISFSNSSIQNGVPIAIILQYGHGTGTGGWVEGIDYINPAIKPIFKTIEEEAWREVTKP